MKEHRTEHVEVDEDGTQRLPAFWASIHGAGQGYLGLFSGLRPSPGGRLVSLHQYFVRYPVERALAVRWIAREAGQDRELYHCAHLLARPRRRAEDALPLSSLYVDLDGPLPEPPMVAPSLVVESSPGHAQLYFRLQQPVAPQVGAALNRRLAAALGGDPSGWDLSQVLRLPGTRNYKYPERPLVRLLASQALVYRAEELAALLPEAPSPSPRVAPARPVLAERPLAALAAPPVPLSAPAQRYWRGESYVPRPEGGVDRSRSLVRIARILFAAGIGPAHLALLLAERDSSLGWRKYSDRDDNSEQYRRIVDLVVRETRNLRLE